MLPSRVNRIDPGRRAALFDELATLGAQVWMTGADPAAFTEAGDRADRFEVEDGAIQPAR